MAILLTPMCFRFLLEPDNLACCNTSLFLFTLTPTIKQEIAIGIQRGVDYLNNVLTLSENGTLQTLAPTETDSQLVKRLPNKLGQGEAEAIAICQRLGMVFITHDRKAINYCDHTGVDCIPLTDLLAEFESAGVLTVTEIAAIFT